MASLNEFKILGNLTKDPELKNVGANQQPLCLLDVAVNGSRWDPEKEDFVPETEFFNNIAVWGKRGEACARVLGLGSMVLISGSLSIHTWEEPREGGDPKKRRAMQLAVTDVQFLNVKPKTGSGSPVNSGGSDE